MRRGQPQAPADPAGGGRAGPSLKARALRLLAQREHSRLELVRKLQPHAADAAELAATLDQLQAKGFIDEQRVADSVVHRRAPGLGASRVKAELRAKGLDDELVAQAMATLRSTEVERATGVWQKKFGIAPADAAGRAKQMRFLAARGFSPEVVRRVVPQGGRVRADDEGAGDGEAGWD